MTRLTRYCGYIHWVVPRLKYMSTFDGIALNTASEDAGECQCENCTTHETDKSTYYQTNTNSSTTCLSPTISRHRVIR